MREVIHTSETGQPGLGPPTARDRGMPADVESVAAHLEGQAAAEVIIWARQTFGDQLLATSSFQTQSVPMLHLISLHAPELEVGFLDTGYHFPETLAFRDRLTKEFGLNLRILRADLRHGGGEPGLHQVDPDRCCYLNKLEPLRRALAGKQAWLTGIRRDQTSTRQQATVVSRQADGIYKVNPMLTWTSHEVDAYVVRHRLPRHPLSSLGYASVGCEPCTRPVGVGDDARAGRWAGGDKNECGLHLDIPPVDGEGR